MSEILKDLAIKSSELSPVELVDMIRQFCGVSENYTYMQEASEEYALHIDKPACEIHAIYKEPFPLLAFAGKSSGLYLTNIVPKTVSEIGIAGYNQFLDTFVEGFRLFVKGQPERIRILSSSGLLVLEEIIHSNLARKHFRYYLNNHPLSMHSLDIERLDKFICVAASYSRKPIDLDLLHRFLVEQPEWTVEKANWCINRIGIGLDVLRVRRKT